MVTGLALIMFVAAGTAGDRIVDRAYWTCGSMVTPMAAREQAARPQRAIQRQPMQPRGGEPRRRSAPCFRLASA